MTVSYKFDFGIGDAPASSYIQVLPSTIYSGVSGYGFEPNERISSRNRDTSDRLRGAFCIPLEAVFTVDLPNGCYTVTATIGDAIAPTSTTLKYGVGRIVLHHAVTSAGQYNVHSFTVKVTDGQLKLAFSGVAPRINALQIDEAKQATTIYLAGDSTVTDQDTFPYAGWGQMLPLYFKTDVAIDNHAMSGRSSRSFINEGRLAAILEQIKPNDYLWIQFGHNDEKPDAERATEPFGSFKEMLSVYVKESIARGAKPVLITPVHRRKFDGEGRIIDTHGDYLLGMKELAEELEVPLLDLAAKSKALYEQLGDEPSKALFMWAYPGEFISFPEGVQDDTHFQELGGIQIAGLVAEGVRELDLSPLYLYLRGI
ncbi:lysophospholipase L1-like esterase [Paenibacillus castaneae]|uniref:rhamnogalacturonan acetylesterase n=1 Tax=Paenibacillus castaneae TaxID=474957 RepID=UPI000C9C3B5E|nr:GDSL-type esterase/lipase family protein [Paenibacillus castaneae]NIK80448.1 lysophospholipase L1-like esterase [Paenibacillus castaneae]